MISYLTDFMKFMSPAFSRQAAYRWFVVVFVGFVLRSDNFGVSSIVRALLLPPECYTSLLHFFHSTAWNTQGFMMLWWKWLIEQNAQYHVGDRVVLIADHTKTPKDGRKIPAVSTLHQDSETASKPSYFRGHHWGCIALLTQAGEKFFATPLEASIQEAIGPLAEPDVAHLKKTTRIVEMARRFVSQTGHTAILVLDAYFSVGPVFLSAAMAINGIDNPVHILTRAKKNVVAYLPAMPKKTGSVGRKPKYGKKLKLMKLFDSCDYEFISTQTQVYGNFEQVRYLTIDLLWKPTKDMIRFILVESSRGRLILMSSDLNTDPITALHLYCHRVTIETLFDTFKNNMGGMGYHFWSRYLRPTSRKPTKNKNIEQSSSQIDKTRNTFSAIEKFVNIQLLIIGILQLLATFFSDEIKTESRCWLRTVSSNTPSEFVTRSALSNIIRFDYFGSGKYWISLLIRNKDNSLNDSQ